MNDQSAKELMVQGRDVPWLLSQWVERTPDKPFLNWAPYSGEHRTWSYAEFDQDVRRVAAALSAQGLQPGQRLLIHMDNCPELLITSFACAYLGIVAVYTNPHSVQRELSDYCQLTEVVAAVTQAQYSRTLAAAAAELACLWVAKTEAGQDPAHTATKKTTQPFSTLLDAAPYEGRREADPMLDLRVQFTSGTTAQPKAVLSTHANSIFAAQQTARAYALQHDDVCHVVVPLFHNNGMATLVMSTLWVGGSLLLQPGFSASNFWAPALQYRATWASLPSSFFINALKKYPVPEHCFRFWFFAVVPEVEQHFKLRTRGHWGMTETITLPLVGDPHHEGPPMNIGRPAAGNEIAIRRPDGSDCTPGETGDLYVRGVRGITLFKEYLNNPKATAESFDAEGWFNTGDRIRLDEQGNLFFADRSKDIIRVGGENVAASEIEAVIQKTGWVRECAVVGQRHNMLEEVPVAFIIPTEDAPPSIKEKLIQHCTRQLADFKVMRDVHILDEFPRVSLGKISRQQLRENLPIIE